MEKDRDAGLPRFKSPGRQVIGDIGLAVGLVALPCALLTLASTGEKIMALVVFFLIVLPLAVVAIRRRSGPFHRLSFHGDHVLLGGSLLGKRVSYDEILFASVEIPIDSMLRDDRDLGIVKLEDGHRTYQVYLEENEAHRCLHEIETRCGHVGTCSVIRAEPDSPGPGSSAEPVHAGGYLEAVRHRQIRVHLPETPEDRCRAAGTIGRKLVAKGLGFTILGVTIFVLCLVKVVTALGSGFSANVVLRVTSCLSFGIALTSFGWYLLRRGRKQLAGMGGLLGSLGKIRVAGIVISVAGCGVFLFGLARISRILNENGSHFDAVSSMFVAAIFLILGGLLLRLGRSAQRDHEGDHEVPSEP